MADAKIYLIRRAGGSDPHNVPRVEQGDTDPSRSLIGTFVFAMTYTASNPRFIATSASAARLSRLKRLAWLIDGAFRLPGTKFRFGLNSLIGLTPAAGDAVLAGLSLYIVYEAHRLGVPRDKLARMIRNVGIEAAAGAVPILGDLFDMGFKANLRNLAIIEEHVGGVAPRR